MRTFIIKVGENYYMWDIRRSVVATEAMTLEGLKEYIFKTRGKRGMELLPDRLKRVALYGCSGINYSLNDVITINRNGLNGTALTKEEFLSKYGGSTSGSFKNKPMPRPYYRVILKNQTIKKIFTKREYGVEKLEHYLFDVLEKGCHIVERRQALFIHPREIESVELKNI